MIEIDPDLPELTRDLLNALRAMLSADGVDPGDVDAFPGARASSSPYRFDYPADALMGTPSCFVVFPAKDGEHVVETDFSSGRILLAALLTLKQAPRSSEFARDDDASTILISFGLDPLVLVRTKVPDEPDRTFVAPDRQSFVYGYRDIYPPVRIISRSRYSAAPAIHLAMDEQARKANLHARLASFLP